MRPLLSALLLGAMIALAPAAQAQRPAPTSSAPIALYLGGHTTTVQFGNDQRGLVHMTLALLPNGTGWLFSEAGPGGTLTPRLRYIYRWWVAQDGRFCYLYSPASDNLQGRSLWTCWNNRLAADGTPVLLNGRGEPLPVIARTRGNGLEARGRIFMQDAAMRYGGAIPTPQDPTPPPPP